LIRAPGATLARRVAELGGTAAVLVGAALPFGAA
jgi:hypothetical protein